MRDLERRIARLERKILANQGSMCVVELFSIDAWGNPDDGWEWNQWFRIDQVETGCISSEEEALDFFISQDLIFSNKTHLVSVEDNGEDSYVLKVKETGEPLFFMEIRSI